MNKSNTSQAVCPHCKEPETCICDMKPSAHTPTLEKVEACIAWATQNGYCYGEDAAHELSQITSRKMSLDQAYYNNYKWEGTCKDIVHCVNMHDELVGMCEMSLHKERKCYCSDNATCHRCYLKEIITKAKAN